MRFLLRFIRLESSSGIVLMFVTLLALLVANSSLYHAYHQFLMFPVSLHLGALQIDKSMEHFINDGLMAIFFLLIGLEIKRELLEGELSSVKKAILPFTAAIGGVALPAIIYVALNQGTDAVHGWAIPSATDIAFSLGILALFGSRLPVSLKVFLMAVAVIDDLIAVLIIAFFYTGDINMVALAWGGLAVLVLLALNIMHASRPSLFILVGLVLWVCILKSGVHATIAGVILGLCIPLKASQAGRYSMSKTLEHALHPWVAFFIMPVFAFANAGISFDGLTFEDMLHPIPLGIALGLFFGKQLGIFGFTWLMVKLKLATVPRGASWGAIYGVAMIAGIGFTMSLFIGGLSFSDPQDIIYTRLGVLAGSLLSAVFGYIVLSMALKKSAAETRKNAVETEEDLYPSATD